MVISACRSHFTVILLCFFCSESVFHDWHFDIQDLGPKLVP